jgi:predicted acyltransferase
MNQPEGGTRPRLVALDLLRGAAVAGMILANSPGSWAHGYAPLLHADWNGWTLTDMVFPTFLFSVGMAIGLSFPRPLSTSVEQRLFWTRALRRAAALIGLGLFINLLPYFDFPHLRLPGVLQRIALCYLAALALVVATARREADGRLAVRDGVVAGAIITILLLYWALLTFVPVPGFGAGRLDPTGNLTAWIDRTVLTVPHLWSEAVNEAGETVYDPEGLLSTVPAIANVLFGLLAVAAYRRGVAPTRLAVFGALILLLGTWLDPVFPINKKLWTSSFVLVSSGFAFVLLALLMALSRSSAALRAMVPLRVFGSNAILAFVLSQLLGVFGALRLLAGGQTPQEWGFATAFAMTGDARLASLMCAVAILLLILAVLVPLHRRGIHLRL